MYAAHLGRFCSRDPIGYGGRVKHLRICLGLASKSERPIGASSGSHVPRHPGVASRWSYSLDRPPFPHHRTVPVVRTPYRHRQERGWCIGGNMGDSRFVEPTPVGEVIAGGATIIVLARSLRGVVSVNKGITTWLRCQKPSNDEPAHAIPGLPQFEGMAGPYLTGACTVFGPRKRVRDVAAEGHDTTAQLPILTISGIVQKPTAGVFCFNRCHKIQNGNIATFALLRGRRTGRSEARRLMTGISR